VALGDGSFAGAYNLLSSVTAVGTGSKAIASSLGLALSAGTNASTHAGAGSTEMVNLAVSIGSSNAEALGNGSAAVNLFGSGSEVLSFGTGNVAFNTGDQSFVHALGRFSTRPISAPPTRSSRQRHKVRRTLPSAFWATAT
jgi:hypothetical protein